MSSLPWNHCPASAGIAVQLVPEFAGCSIISVHGDNRAENKPIESHQIGTLNIDAQGAAISPDYLKSKFVGVALSGGGSRAANFSAAVLEELDTFDLVRKSNVISSVSGGGLAGAYYALNVPKVDWPLLREKLGTDFLGVFLRKWAMPWHWPSIVFTDETRADVMADVFDDVLFSKKSYQDLPKGAPIFLANATDITAGGKRVVFSNEYFLSELGSSLASMRIAIPVATSAAFPGVFDSVVFERFKRNHILTLADGTSSWSPPSYVHLIDGGASDNLGVETLWDAALAQLYGNKFKKMPESLGEKPCVMISVDANAPNTSSRLERSPDERGMVDYFLNRNMFDAIDALFEARRQDSLIKMGLGQSNFGTHSIENFGDLTRYYVNRNRTGLFNIPVNCQLAWERYECQVDFSIPVPPAKRVSFQCFIWHIALDDVASVGVKVEIPKSGHDDDKPRRNSLVRLERLVTQIETNWRLTGPEKCTTQQLQDALYTSARILVRDDEVSRFALCDYLLEKQVINGSSLCKKKFPLTNANFPFVATQAFRPSFATDSSRTPNQPVKCFIPKPSALHQ